MDSIFTRTSVRQYLDKKVEQEKIDYILRAAMAAPSAGNQQPWEFIVTDNKDILTKLAESSPYATCVKNAPLAFIVCYKTDIKYPEYGEIDASVATQNMLLAIDSQQLGGVWLGIAPIEERMEYVEKVLDIPSGNRAFAIVCCGYPNSESKPTDRYDEQKIRYIY